MNLWICAFGADCNVCDGDLSVCTICTTSQMERLPDTQSASSSETKRSQVFLYQSIRDRKKQRERSFCSFQNIHMRHIVITVLALT